MVNLKVFNQLFPFFGTEVPVLSDILENISSYEKLIVFAIRELAASNNTSELFVSEGQILFNKPLINTNSSLTLSECGDKEIWDWFIEYFLFFKIESEEDLEKIKESIFEKASLSIKNRNAEETIDYLNLLVGLDVGKEVYISFRKFIDIKTEPNKKHGYSIKIDEIPIVENLIKNMRCVGDFYINKYPVTQEEWEAVMGNNPSFFKGNDKRPVESVSWNDAQEFIQKLNNLTGKQFRLPTEEEWEYAAKGGENYRYAGSNNIDEVAWYDDNSQATTHPVGLQCGNGYGLYDMSGNVWEWTSKHRDFVNRVIRGGSWGCDPKLCCVTLLNWSNNSNRSYTIGFRLAMNKIPTIK